MDFAPSERTRALAERLERFMREEVLPPSRSTPRNSSVAPIIANGGSRP